MRHHFSHPLCVIEPIRIAVTALALAMVVAGGAHAQSLEEENRRPSGIDSLVDDSERLHDDADVGTDSLGDDSPRLRGRTADQDGTNSLDNGSMDDGDASDDE